MSIQFHSPLARRGFTLVELLTAVAIVAILTVLASGSVMRSIRSGQSVQSCNNLRQLTLANVAYASDRGTFAPASDRQNRRRWHGARTSSNGKFDARQGFLSPYLGRDARVVPCPVLTQMLKKQGKTFEEGSGGYGYNAVYLGGVRDSEVDATGAYVALPFIRVTHPATTVMFATSAYARATGIQEYPFAEPPFWDFGDGPSGSRPSPTVHFRFNGQAIVGWCDGHVSFVRPDPRPAGANPHGGDTTKDGLGWFGPDAENGFWNAERD
jgi:prepilin-type N-terminal cleavage/methylation domain-containing protein/prepilin-type processing-associated H-X9-DG protein